MLTGITMYRVSASTSFDAHHFLTVPDAGTEGEPHSHRYGIDLEVAGPRLNDHDYLVNVDDMVAELDAFADRYRDVSLNEQPAFEGHNPSIELFSRIACDFFRHRLPTDRLEAIAVTVSEDEVARATCTVDC